MILEKDEKVFIVERKYFKEDIRRIFCGEVLACSENLLRAKGYVWVMSQSLNQFLKKPEMRERIFCLGNRIVINVMPRDIDINLLRCSFDQKKGHSITDGTAYSLNIDEFGQNR
jgi:hypothetical protein